MTNGLRGVDSGKYEGARDYRQAIDPEAALRLFRMAMYNQSPDGQQLPPTFSMEPVASGAPEAPSQTTATNVVELFARSRAE